MVPPNPRFPRLLSPFQIGDGKRKNRIVKLPQAMRIADEGGHLSGANRGSRPPGRSRQESLNIPVMVIGRLDAELGEWIRETGKADLIALARRLLADPEYPNKIAAGKKDGTLLLRGSILEGR